LRRNDLLPEVAVELSCHAYMLIFFSESLSLVSFIVENLIELLATG
jgi:hypothetical protein